MRYSCPVALVLEQVSFAYESTRPVLAGLSVAFSPGKVTAIIGPNGAGKSTLLKLAVGLRAPGAGRVMLADREISLVSVRERAERLIYLPQHSSVAFDYTASEVVAMGMFAREHSGQSADSALRSVGLESRANDAFHTLSAGQQQRVGLARALAQIGARQAEGERFLLADEPASAMDPPHAMATLATLREIAADGIGVAIVLHDLSLALRFADEAILLDASGHLLAAGAVGRVLTTGALSALFGIEFEQLLDACGRPAAFVPAPPSLPANDHPVR